VVAADRHVGPRGAVVVHRAHAHDDPGTAGDTLDLPDQRHRMEHPAMLQETRHAIGDLDRVACRVGEPGDQDRRIVDVALLALRHADQGDAEQAALPSFFGDIEQRAKRRVTVESRQAPPHDVAARVDEKPDCAVADQCKIE
jgi:hypothetical protein